jgi:hypothetical protein
MNECFKALTRLLEDATLYIDQLKPPQGETRICVELSDTKETATLVLGNNPQVLKDSQNPDCKILMEKRVLLDLLERKADAFALAGRGKMDEKRPIDFEIYNKERAGEIWEVIKTVLTCFFTPGKIKVKSLKPELAGLAHGAHPIPLVYWNGMRSSWILVKKGEILNKEGERDPWPQLFMILQGKGRCVVGGVELGIEPSLVVYVPKNTVHQLMAEEDTTMIWLAWQAH